ncbi:MAG: Gfo/Idh/MocA family oxidoreductase [Gammaproteobacteria bacterium]|nr:Gfo/Idh/MocA family oxidoreductase [Gammaproteobacteria bacterium]
MSEQHPVAVIGLGVMGQRMLANMHKYPGFEPVVVWDPDPQACRSTAERYPMLRVADSANDAITASNVACVYIACPPQHHYAAATEAFAAGKSVWCEKPLGVDAETSAALVSAATASGLANIVNFSLASAIATHELEGRLKRGALGEIQSIDLRLHFARWPRQWQEAASSWLSFRKEGGFTREVVSHWVYLTQRLFGTPVLEHARCRYPDAHHAETHLLAMLDVGGLPFSIAASSGGVGPDIVEYTVQGERGAFRIHDWNTALVSDGHSWQSCRDDIVDPREAGYQAQLANAANAIAGRAHTMPDFRFAFEVQTTIEAMLE